MWIINENWTVKIGAILLHDLCFGCGITEREREKGGIDGCNDIELHVDECMTKLQCMHYIMKSAESSEVDEKQWDVTIVFFIPCFLLANAEFRRLESTHVF